MIWRVVASVGDATLEVGRYARRGDAEVARRRFLAKSPEYTVTIVLVPVATLVRRGVTMGEMP